MTRHHAPRFLSVGARFAFAEVASLDALGRAVPDTGAFRRAEAALPAEAGPEFALFLYARTETPERLRARMFAPLDNIPEDPATGSAAAALGAFLHAREGRGAVTIEQGVEMGRPSRIEVTVDAKEDRRRRRPLRRGDARRDHGLKRFALRSPRFCQC